MKTEVGRNWYHSINFDKMSCLQVSFSGPKWTPSRGEPEFLSVLSTFWRHPDQLGYFTLIQGSMQKWRVGAGEGYVAEKVDN